VLIEKSVIAGFFAAALLCFWLFRESLARGETAFLWQAALAVYVVAAALALWRVARTPGFAVRRPRWLLPRGFWPVVGYTQAENVVNYLYASLAPSVVLFWVDLRALGHLHAALRYVVVSTAFPAALAAVLGPELRHLVTSGHRDDALRQTAGAVRSALLVLGPTVLGLIVLAEDAMGVFGPGFREHADVLRFAAPGILATPVVLCGAAAAVSIGAFSGYLRGSILYVVTSIGLVALLVPRWGLPGAAAAMSLGALSRQTAIVFVLSREGFRAPSRLHASWVCAALAVAVCLWLQPGRLLAGALLLGLLGLFVLLGGVRLGELRRAATWGLGR
jgi:O-antigen/teichoic acid export membrane protein